MGKSKIVCKKLEILTGDQKCVFCQRADIDEMKYGPIYTHKNVITHYYCLLLSSNMEQNGRDSDGILGFLANDIHKEVRRGVRLYCTYCRGGGATLGCAIAKCKVVFHLPCGMKHGTLHQFFGEFKSFCAKHRPVQKISANILAEASKNAMCGICYEKVVPRPIHETLWAPCCQKSAFFHRDCVQKLATSAGYFFKCPLCNNTSTFQKEMKEFGIYIPEQDASWECVPNAYQDLLVRHDSCDSPSCSCPSGRKFNNQGTRWELVLCKFCGSQGMHIGCGRLKWKSPEFICDICAGNTDASEESERSHGDRHRLTGVGRGRAAPVRPSVPAVREREKIVDDDSDDNYSSDESEKVIVSNRRGRRRVVSPSSPVETKPVDTRPLKSDKQEKKPPTIVAKVEEPSSTATVLIDDSDSDVEVVEVEESKGGSCLKTKDGATIPIIKMRDSVKKRLNIEGDVNIVPDEIITIVDVKEGPPSKKHPPPQVEEVIYSMPTPAPKPSTSTYCPPASFTATVPDTGGLGTFVLVDPSTFRPEDLPPGTMLYRSYAPMVPVPQMTAPPPPPPQPQPQPQPMQQLGRSYSADAQHPDLCQHGGWSGLHINSTADDAKKRSKQHNSSRRRGRPRRRCDNDRLNPRVVLSPLKCRLSNSGHVEILLPKRNLGLGLAFQSLKRKLLPLPSRPAKKLKLSKDTVAKEKKEKSRNSKSHMRNKSHRKKSAPQNLDQQKKQNNKRPAMKSPEREADGTSHESPKKKVCKQSNTNLASILPPHLFNRKKEVKTPCKKVKANSSLGKEPKVRKTEKGNKCSLTQWTGKKIDEYLKKSDVKELTQLDYSISNTESGPNTEKDFVDIAEEKHLQCDTVMDKDKFNSSFEEAANSNINSGASEKPVLELFNTLVEKDIDDTPSMNVACDRIESKQLDYSITNSHSGKDRVRIGSVNEFIGTIVKNLLISDPVKDNYYCDSTNKKTDKSDLNSNGNEGVFLESCSSLIKKHLDEITSMNEINASKDIEKENKEFEMSHGNTNKNLPLSSKNVKIDCPQESNEGSNFFIQSHLSKQTKQDDGIKNKFPKTNHSEKNKFACKTTPKIKIQAKSHRFLKKDVFNFCENTPKKVAKSKSNRNDFKRSLLRNINNESSEFGKSIHSSTSLKSMGSFKGTSKKSNWKLTKVSPTSIKGTIENYFTSIKKETHVSQILAFPNTTCENNYNSGRGKENDCLTRSLVELDANVITPAIPAAGATSTTESSPVKYPLSERTVLSAVTAN